MTSCPESAEQEATYCVFGTPTYQLKRSRSNGKSCYLQAAIGNGESLNAGKVRQTAGASAAAAMVADLATVRAYLGAGHLSDLAQGLMPAGYQGFSSTTM
jgi:hypothetical protein